MKQRGSVLIEAIAAVVILATSLSLIMQSFASQYRATVMHQDYAKALVFLENRLSYVIYKGIGTEAIKGDEACPEPFERFHYHFKSEGISLEGDKGLEKVNLSVAWPSGKAERSIDVVTYVKGLDVTQSKHTSMGN